MGSEYTAAPDAESGTSRGDRADDLTTPEEDIRLGICSNCSNLETCSYRTLGQAVWYCEEYSLAPLPALIPDTLLPPFGIKRFPGKGEAAGRKRPELEADDIDAILQRQGTGTGWLIAVLEEIQSAAGYLPEKALRMVSEKTGRPMVDLYGIATFYRYFSLKPRGRHTISVCQGTACHVRGAPALVDEFKRQLNVKPGETTADGAITLETVNCLGACALGPIVVGGDRYFSRVEAIKVRDILKKVRNESRTKDIEGDPRFFPIAVRCPLCSRSLMDPGLLIDGHPSVRLTAAYGEDRQTIRFSSLYGSGAVEYEREIPVDAETVLSCPYCAGTLEGESSCPECGNSMAPLHVEGGGLVQICTRRGCKGHTLDLTLDYF
ncbi:MAG: NAD(P)H-dependent oxidoreductase subunit E [Acidobacteria bacterium]|nr:NAD(P)H-dependent oxidoreductase subunit E [Acidobacteriota bacterium]